MDAVTEADIVRQLIQLAIDRDEPGVAAAIRVQCGSVTRGNQWVGKDVGAIEEELQDRDASASHSAMSGGIGRVRRRTFRKGLGQEVAVVSGEGGLHRLRVQHGRAKLAVDGVALICLDQIHDGAARFGTMAKMYKPLLE